MKTENTQSTIKEAIATEKPRKLISPQKAIERATFSCPCQKVPLDDGRWVITPMEPNMRCRTEDTVAITGIPAKTLYRLAEAGFIRCARLTEGMAFFWPMEIEELIERVANDPAYASKVNNWADTDLRVLPAP